MSSGAPANPGEVDPTVQGQHDNLDHHHLSGGGGSGNFSHADGEGDQLEGQGGGGGGGPVSTSSANTDAKSVTPGGGKKRKKDDELIVDPEAGIVSRCTGLRALHVGVCDESDWSCHSRVALERREPG